MKEQYLKLRLREDYNYDKDNFIRALVAFNRVDYSFAEQVYKELIEYIRKRLRPQTEYIKHVFIKFNPDLDIEVDSPKVTYDNNKEVINLGQWIGRYKIELDSADLEVEVVPKIGWDSMMIMLNDISKMVRMFGFPMLELIFSNILGHSLIKQYISYSIRLMQLTELMINEGVPPVSYEKEYFVNYDLGYVGRINIGKTLRYLNHGQNILVARKVVIGHPILPISVLVKFHYVLGNELLNSMKKLDTEVGKNLPSLKEFIQQHAFYHIYITSLPPFSNYLTHALNADLESLDILRRARDQAKTNRWLREIIDLYMSFLLNLNITNLELLSKKISIQPLPSSKIYEVWILYMLLEVGKKFFNTRIVPTNFKLKEFDLKKCKIIYNDTPATIIPYTILHMYEKPRLKPDFSILNGDKQAVADANTGK